MAEQPQFPEAEDGVTSPAERLPLLGYLDEMDPHHKLADPAVRAEILVQADPFAASMALREVHQRVGEHDEEISSRLVNLAVDDAINYTGVSPEARSEVFNYALDAAKEAAGRGNLELAGRILGGSIEALQTFTDANKRTARAAYMLTAHGYDGSDADRTLLADAIAPKELEYTSMITFRPYVDWNIIAFLTHDHGDDPEWVDRMKQVGLRWFPDKPSSTEMSEMITEVIPDCERPLLLSSVIQDHGLGPYILTNHLGVDIGILGNRESLDLPALRELLSKLTNADAEAIISESEALKVKYLKFLIDKTLEAAEAGDAIKGTPADHVNITGKPLMDAAYNYSHQD